jgi:mRNA interferase HigB
MRVISKRALLEFAHREPRARQPLLAWYRIVKGVEWQNPADMKASFRSADFLVGSRAIFDIGGNKYRIVAEINYRRRCVFIRFVGTHAEYDGIAPTTVKRY